MHIIKQAWFFLISSYTACHEAEKKGFKDHKSEENSSSVKSSAALLGHGDCQTLVKQKCSRSGVSLVLPGL